VDVIDPMEAGVVGVIFVIIAFIGFMLLLSRDAHGRLVGGVILMIVLVLIICLGPVLL